jgi:nitrite reductase/ring-hydroxylating ferredoxin subunit
MSAGRSDDAGRPLGPRPRRRVRLLPVGALLPGEMRRVEPAGCEPLAVYNVGGAFHVTADTCPHGQVSLTEGDLDGDVVVCPGHFAEFDVRSGAPVTAFPVTRPVAVYQAAVEDGLVVAEVPDAGRAAGCGGSSA